jgi:hypothetical protein
MSEQPRRFKPAQSLKQRVVERVRRHVEANLLPPGAQTRRASAQDAQADPGKTQEIDLLGSARFFVSEHANPETGADQDRGGDDHRQVNREPPRNAR